MTNLPRLFDMVCATCGGKGHLNQSPDDSWWSHNVHPDDGHDFSILGEMTYEELKTAIYELPESITRNMRKCLGCNRPPFYAPGTKARDEGHIYSIRGLAEFGMSGFCEYCFDKITDPGEDEAPLTEESWDDHKAIADGIILADLGPEGPTQ